MGLIQDILGGDQSYSTTARTRYPSDLIPPPDLKAFDKKTAKKLYNKWLETNERIAWVNNTEKLLDAVTFTALFLGQCGFYAQLNSFKTEQDGQQIDTRWDSKVVYEGGKWVVKPVQVPVYEKVFKTDWARVSAVAGIITALTYLVKDNPAGVGIPVGGLATVIGVDQAQNFLGLFGL